MNATFYAAAAFGLAAVAVTVYAFLTAKEGYEDDEGFHAIRSRDESKGTAAASKHDHPDPESPSPPPFPAR